MALCFMGNRFGSIFEQFVRQTGTFMIASRTETAQLLLIEIPSSPSNPSQDLQKSIQEPVGFSIEFTLSDTSTMITITVKAFGLSSVNGYI